MLVYLFTASVLLLVFAFGYFIFLQQAPALALRRRVLLLGLVGTVLLPLCPAPPIPQFSSGQVSATRVVEVWETEMLSPVSLVSTVDAPSDSSTVYKSVSRTLNPKAFLVLSYLLIVSLFLGRLVVGLVRLGSIHRRSRTTGEPDIRIIEGRGEAFTFGRTVYLSETVYDSADAAVIIAHERAHARQLHTLDALLVEVLRAVFWFHPMAWWLRDQVQLNLEYLADAAVLRAGYDRRAYQLSLVAHQQGTDFRTSLLPQFAAKGLKRRIRMMGFRAGPQVRSLVAVGVLIFLGFVAFACTAGEAEVIGFDNNAASVEGAFSPELPPVAEGEAVELNIYFKRLPTPAEVALIRQPLSKYFNREISVFQSCEDPAGTYTLGSGSKMTDAQVVKLAVDDFSPQPRRFQINRNGKGGSGSAAFRPQALPSDAPDEDILLNLNGEWISVTTTDKTPFRADNLNPAPRNEQIKCQLGLTPETKSGFNVSTQTYGNSNGSFVKGKIDELDQDASVHNIVTNKAYYYGSEEIDQVAFIERAKATNHVLTIAKRVGDTEIFMVLRLDPIAPGE